MKELLMANLVNRIKSGEFVISVQLDPPYTDATKSKEDAAGEFIVLAEKLKRGGVAYADINAKLPRDDRTYFDAFYAAGLLKRGGFGVMPHVATRDVRSEEMVRAITSAYISDGICDFLIVAGDKPERKNGSAGRKSVKVADALNELSKLPIRPEICLVAAVNQNDSDAVAELENLKLKENAGADIFMSQIVFSKSQADDLAEFLGRAGTPAPFVAGIWPLSSRRTISALREGRVGGVVVDDDTHNESLRYEKDADLAKWGAERAASVLEYIGSKRIASGVYVVAPAKNPLIVLEVLKNNE